MCLLSSGTSAEDGVTEAHMARLLLSWTTLMMATCVTASAQTRYVTSDITGGSFNADTSSPNLRASYDITGPGFHFVADGVEPGVIFAATMCFGPGCRPGDVVSLTGNFTGTYLGRGMAVVGAETLSPAYFSGQLSFVTEPVTIPPGHRKHLILSTPFTLRGSPDGAYPAALGAWPDTYAGFGPYTDAWTSATLMGSGTATAFFRRDRYGKDMPERFYYVLERVIYSFTGPAVP
jgi:hypothetical protein